jgi:hypothetical protein
VFSQLAFLVGAPTNRRMIVVSSESEQSVSWLLVGWSEEEKTKVGK